MPATGGAQAFQRLAVRQPDLILLDLLMPQMDGFEVCRRLRSDASTRNIPILIISALDDPESRARAASAGATAYYTKPFSPIALLKEIDRHRTESKDK